MQILFIQLSNKKQARSYYLAIDSNNQEFKFIFNSDSLFYSKSNSINDISEFEIGELDTTGSYAYVNPISDINEPNAVPTYFIIKKKSELLKIMFLNSSVKNVIGKSELLLKLEQSFKILEREFQGVKIFEDGD